MSATRIGLAALWLAWAALGSSLAESPAKGGPVAGSDFELPAARPLDSETAQRLLESDWLFQADGRPTVQRSLQEIGWARELARRLEAHPAKPDLAAERTVLDPLEAKLRALPPEQADDEAKALYFAVRRAKRTITWKNPVLDFDRLLVVDGPYPKSRRQRANHQTGHRNGCWYSNSGSRLLLLEGLGPNAKVRDLLPGHEGFLWRPELSFDADRILFCFMPKEERSFHLYLINLDGTGLRQLTNSPYDDLDPIYLPDGHLLFTTTRGNTYVRCGPYIPAYVLARCDADGRNIHIISRNNETDYLPALLPDGRVLYTRWEYTDRPEYNLMGLWTVNPDGTGDAVYWGNRSFYPDLLVEARPVPGTDSTLFAGAAHHSFFDGCLGLVDVRRGREWPDGVYKVTADIPWPEVGDSKDGPNPIATPRYHASGRYTAYKSPYPLGSEDFLVSARTGMTGSWNDVRFKETFALYLMDVYGNRELMYRGVHNVWYAVTVKPRPRPPAIPDRVAWPKKGEPAGDGVLFSPNVYEGTEGLPPGKAKYLRVLQLDYKTYTAWRKTWWNSGPAISVVQQDGVKRILGTVPIREDGSVSVRVPSGQQLYFQLLDENQRCLQIMRSFTGVMPGETRGCVGCHEQHSRAFPVSGPAVRIADPPAALTSPPWGAHVSIGYERFAQPVLDKHCGKCHQGDGEARKALDLTLRGGVIETGLPVPQPLRAFKEPYLTLVGLTLDGKGKTAPPGPGVGIAGCLNIDALGNGPIKPLTMLSYASPLIQMAMSGKHYNVKIEGEELLRLIAWVDSNCVYRGDEEVRQIPDPDIGGFPIPPKIRTAPVIDRLQPVTDALPGRE
jgi:hypothetical protein